MLHPPLDRTLWIGHRVWHVVKPPPSKPAPLELVSSPPPVAEYRLPLLKVVA